MEELIVQDYTACKTKQVQELVSLSRSLDSTIRREDVILYCRLDFCTLTAISPQRPPSTADGAGRDNKKYVCIQYIVCTLFSAHTTTVYEIRDIFHNFPDYSSNIYFYFTFTLQKFKIKHLALAITCQCSSEGCDDETIML